MIFSYYLNSLSSVFAIDMIQIIINIQGKDCINATLTYDCDNVLGQTLSTSSFAFRFLNKYLNKYMYILT